MVTAASTLAAGRLKHIDGLRGIAALLVVLFHVVEFSPARTELLEAMGPVADLWPYLGAIGVNIFFLLSGFVLFRSLERTRTSAGRFIVRRQLRLDPAYWAVIGLTLAFSLGKAFIPGLTGGEYSVGDVLVNLVYLQGILDRPFILSVSWTLCLEVQLYLLLLAVFVAARRITGTTRTLPVTLLVSGLGAVVLTRAVGHEMTWVWGPWPLFCVGALLYVGREDRRWTCAAVGLLVFRVAATPDVSMIEIASLAFALAVLVGWGPLTRALGSSWLTWLGLRSYSLYLFHHFAIDVTTRPIYKISPSLGVSAAASVLAIGTSILVADVAFRLVERPSLRLAEAAKGARLVDLRPRWRPVAALEPRDP